MSSTVSLFSQSIGRKLVMGITGLFLVSFLFVHMSGNLLLFKGDGGVAFNEYTKFMTTNPVVGVLEWVLFGGFIVHIIYAAVLTRQNRIARPTGYKAPGGKAKSSSWFSRNMGLSGSIVLIFLIVHLVMFWGFYHFGQGENVSVDQAYKEVWKVTQVEAVQNSLGETVVEPGSYLDREGLELLKEKGVTEVKGISMTEVVKNSFSLWYVVLLYVVAMGLLSMHLNHGFQSAFRTLGLAHRKYTPFVMKAGTAIAIVVPLVFAVMPIYYFIMSLS